MTGLLLPALVFFFFFCGLQPLFLVFGSGSVAHPEPGATGDSPPKQSFLGHNSHGGPNATVDHLYGGRATTLENSTNSRRADLGRHSNQGNQDEHWTVIEQDHSGRNSGPTFNEHATETQKTYISMQKPMRNLTRNIGAKAVFYCDLVGKPIPQIHWFKDQNSITENPPKFRIETGLWGSSLRIDQVQKSDEGTYLCIASNPSGTLNVTARLRVTDKAKSNFPTKPQVPGDESLPLPETDGFCQDFHSNVCGKFLLGHRVYVTREFQQAFTETQISKFLKLTATQPLHLVREDCLRHIMEAMCYYNFPICLPVEESAGSSSLRTSRESIPYESIHQSDPVGTNSLAGARHQLQLPQIDYQPYYLCQQDCRMVKENECRTTYEYLESTILRELPGMIMNCARLPQYSSERLGVCRRIGEHDVQSLTRTHAPFPSPPSGGFWGNSADPPDADARAPNPNADTQHPTTKPVQLRGQLPTTPDFIPIFISISALILVGILILGICFICRRTRETSLRLQTNGSGMFGQSRSNGGSFGRLNVMPFDTGGQLFRGQGVGSSLESTSAKKRRVPGMGSGIKTSTNARLLNTSDENYCLAYTQVVNATTDINNGKSGANGLHIASSGVHTNHLPVPSTPQATTASYHQYEAKNCPPKSMPPPNSPAPPPPALLDFQRNKNNYYNSSLASNSLNDRPDMFRKASGFDPVFSPIANRATVESSPTAYTTLRNTSPSGAQTSDPPSQLAYQFCQQAEDLSEKSDKPSEYAISQLRFGKQFGQGVFGPVYKAELLPSAAYDNGIPVSVIVKTLSAGSPASLQNDFKREAELISGLDHPNVLSMLGVSMQHPPWCMIFEIRQYLDLCELMSARRSAAAALRQDGNGDEEFHVDGGHQSPGLSYNEKLCVLAQVAAGMEYLSSHRFVHRDLAARNVIIVRDNLHCKITDLGLARDCYTNDYYRIHPHSLMLPIRWMPLDSIIYGKFTVESDIWAFGVLMWEIWSDGGRPYSSFSDTDVLDLIRARQLLQSPMNCPVKVYAFMHQCWSEEAERRPSFKDCIYQIDQWQIEGNASDSTSGNAFNYNPPFSENNSNNLSGARTFFIFPENGDPPIQAHEFQSHYTSVLEKQNVGISGDPTPCFEGQYSGCSNEGLLTQCSHKFSRPMNHVSPDGSSGAGIINSVKYLPCALPSTSNASECSPAQAYYDTNGTFINFGMQLLPNSNNVYLPNPEPVV